ncbi:Uncharacterized conserved protein [Plasmopara halstedii]|uniref:Uncharacterized conserved protein n=1 Tax=Plasmopara halstedii TaxID=4781 RepID=A0A0P1A6D0_PLAHL|nr:Uncharacterized conserved protein [Plasmopara halstedii]CEG35788.1 Uncharacterized conserved protein [Plasmopara halstedii]|eukprot:XP_024572157.1 Uncharacterized conserved protein [Plasmopara halstedii]
MELGHPLVRVPFEGASKNFRLYHKQLTRELAQATAQIEALDNPQQPGQRIDIETAITKLAELEKKLQDLKQSAKNNAIEQEIDLQTCVTRIRHLKELEDSKPVGDSFTLSQANKLLNDRLIADFLLSQGYFESAKIIETTKGVDHLVDHKVHAECQAVLKDLQAHRTEHAITWCLQNGSRLRRLQSTLEFQLRMQDFIELVRARKLLNAVQHARTYLTPLAMQSDKQTLRDAAISEVQIAMATLAFESPHQCGIEAYEKVFATDRWVTLERMFRKTFNDVYGMHSPPTLCIALYTGLSTLNTRACHLTRNADSKVGAHGKRQRRNRDSDGVVKDSGNESDELQLESVASEDKDKLADATGSKKRKYFQSQSVVPICPACSEIGSQLCTGLPFAYHPHSRLVCRVTQSVMDERNPPLVLPNGRVYSKQGIELLTQSHADGMIKCIDTQDEFSPDDVKPVYIL